MVRLCFRLGIPFTVNFKVLVVYYRYPITLFNELYYLNSGGTIWTGTCGINFYFNDDV